ncbi:MAG: cysteine desulfurase NifS [Defluviitaleaceae bacterium]|nr:cysteine desulfurase NifS [Defluviitaleaceae bacterium]
MKYDIYVDNAATTKMSDEVLSTMLPFFTENYGNAASTHKMGSFTRKSIDNVRNIISEAIGASNPNEIYFTGTGTEADNWAIKGIAFANKNKGNHIITTSIEHHAILHPCEDLEKNYGFEITYLKVKENGIIDIENLKNAIKPTTILISVMFCNNETGAIQPINEIGAIAKQNNVYFHTDAVQALAYIPINVESMGIDLLSLSAHKLYGPKGIGALYVSNNVKIIPILHGGGQERHRRAGTQNVPAIVGFGEAVRLAKETQLNEVERLKKLTKKLIKGITENIPATKINGDETNRMPHIVNITFSFIESEGLLMFLDNRGITASGGSACSSGSFEPSHVLTAMGVSTHESHGSLRISLGRYNTEEDVDIIIKELPTVVSQLRKLSPAYKKYLNENS